MQMEVGRMVTRLPGGLLIPAGVLTTVTVAAGLVWLLRARRRLAIQVAVLDIPSPRLEAEPASIDPEVLDAGMSIERELRRRR